MKSLLIILVVSFHLSLFAEYFRPIDIIVVWGKELDKAKRELFRKHKVKSVTITRKKFAVEINSPNHLLIMTSEYDENGNETRYIHENEFDSDKNYEEEYITDDMGNILEAYKDGRLLARQIFDDSGNMLNKKLYDEDGITTWGYSYEYDNEGSCVFGLQYLYGKVIDTLEYSKYEYIKIREKTLIKSKISLMDKSKQLHDYDSLCRIINYKEFDENGDLSYLVSKDFSSLTGIRIMFHSNDKIYITDSIDINSNGQPVVKRQYNCNGLLEEKSIYEYKNGKLISQIIYSSNGTKIREDLYNTEGKELNSRYFVDGKEMSSASFEYYNNSLPKSEIRLNFKNNDNLSIEYEYEYYE